MRLNIFVKGNADARDALHMLRVGGEVLWNGLNEALRAERRGCTVRVRHETHTCFAALRDANGGVPDGIPGDADLFGPFPPRAQFSDAAFAPGNAAVVLSIQGDLAVPMVRHRRDGYLLHAYDLHRWPESRRAWLRDNFVPVPAPAAEASMADLAGVITRLRRTSDAPILVFNAAAVTPGETIHCYQDFGEVVSQRVRRFNVALVDSSAELGFSIVDVDRIVAEHGARALKIDAFHLNALGCAKVAGEVVRILDDYGLLPARGA